MSFVAPEWREHVRPSRDRALCSQIARRCLRPEKSKVSRKLHSWYTRMWPLDLSLTSRTCTSRARAGVCKTHHRDRQLQGQSLWYMCFHMKIVTAACHLPTTDYESVPLSELQRLLPFSPWSRSVVIHQRQERNLFQFLLDRVGSTCPFQGSVFRTRSRRSACRVWPLARRRVDNKLSNRSLTAHSLHQITLPLQINFD